MARMDRLAAALTAAEQALAQLSRRAGVAVSDAAGTAIRATADHEPRLIASQLPAAQEGEAAARFAARILPSALDSMVARSQSLIVSQARAVPGPVLDQVKRSLVAGVATGSGPRATAREIVARTEGALQGGLSRALVIARTETLDAYRTASRYSQTANADVLDGWVWLCNLGPRTCPACLAKNGTEYPVTDPGPLGHPNCRCSRMPKTKSWADLGIHGVPETAPAIPDARAWFDRLPLDQQTAIMGPARLGLLRSGAIGWDDIPVRREAADWRPSYQVRPLRDLRARATA
jgi:SPP1 gp7 family putative phage head morphogenesis protein